MSETTFRFSAVIRKVPDMDAAYIVFPYDVRAVFGKGRIKVRAKFDDEVYDGSIVNMGLKDENGNILYIIGVTKAIRNKTGKTFGDTLDVTITVK